MNKILSWWDRCFLECRPSVGMGLFRFFLVWTIVAHVAPTLFHIEENFYHGAYLRLNSYFYPLGFLEFVYALPDTVIYFAAVIFWLSAIACFLGVKARANLLVLLCLCYFFNARNSFQLGTLSFDIMLVMLVPVLFYPGLGDAFSIESVWKGEKSWYRKQRVFAVQRLLQLQLTWMFWYTALSKFTAGGNWVTANPFWYLTRYPEAGVVRAFPFKDWLAGQEQVCYALGLTLIVLEFAIPLMWWFRKTRTAGIVLGVAFHGMLWAMLHVPTAFHFLFPGIMLLFIPPESHVRWFERRRERNAAKKPPLIIYDGDCGFCRASMERVWALDPTCRIAYVTAQRIDDWAALPDEVTLERCLEEVVWIGREGEVYGGFDAFRQMAVRLVALWPLVPFLWVPGIPWIGRRVYRWIASHRYLLVPRKGCGSDACKRHPQAPN